MTTGMVMLDAAIMYTLIHSGRIYTMEPPVHYPVAAPLRYWDLRRGRFHDCALKAKCQNLSTYNPVGNLRSKITHISSLRL